MMMLIMKHLYSPVGRRMEAMVVSRTEIDHCLKKQTIGARIGYVYEHKLFRVILFCLDHPYVET